VRAPMPPGPLPVRGRVSPSIRWDEPHLFACFQNLPSAFMHQAMVVVAERKQVGQVARPTPGPELDVMRSRPVDGSVAARPAAAAVVCLQPAPLGRRDGSRRPADVDHHGVRFQDPAQGAVAGQPLNRLARDRHPRLQLRGRSTQLALQAFQGRGHRDVRPNSVALRQLALVHCVVDDLGQGVDPALLWRPAVVLTASL